MRSVSRDWVATAVFGFASACSLLAPNEEDLYGGKAVTGSGGQPGSDGGSNAAGDDVGGARAGGGVSAGAAGVAGARSEGGESSVAGSAGAGTGGAGTGGAGTGGDGTGMDAGGSGGSAGAEPMCAVDCGPNAECTRSETGVACTCVAGFVLEGTACRLPRSCNELHRAAPLLPSGAYSLQPAGATASFEAYCGMMLEGGGWTLVVNEGPTFDPTTAGVNDELCYSSRCVNAGYSQVLLDTDIMIDVSNEPIENATYTARVIVTGVHAMSRGKTLRTLFTTGPNYVDAEDNSNVAVRMIGGAECTTLPVDMASLVCKGCTTAGCKVPVMVFGDNDSACAMPPPRFAIGGANDYATAWTNCAGWPQDPNHITTDFYPDYIRVWLR